jgi:uncharacterized protein (DUF924 family)/predicted metalloenzyme YecM
MTPHEFRYSDFKLAGENFLRALTRALKTSGLDTDALFADHLCHRVSSDEDYAFFKRHLLAHGELLAETPVNGRLIGTFRLAEPFRTETHEVELVELPSPKAGSPYPTGFEHAEFVIDEDFDAFASRLPSIDFKLAAAKTINPELSARVAGLNVKFHRQSLATVIEIEQVLEFWFSELGPKQRFSTDDAVDREIARRFGALVERAARGELFCWRQSIEGRLAEILVLDQFPRNIFRADARAFAADGVALALSQEACRLPQALELPAEKRAFLYMPHMHSESLVVHDAAVKLFSQKGLETNLDFELRHRRILERFGRYPHRNAVLGRASTPEEIAFLEEPGSSF